MSALADYSDEDLARLYPQAGVFDEIHRRYSAHVLRFMRRVANRKSDAEDLAQEVWQRLVRVLPDQFDGGNFRGWLFTIARRIRIDWERKHKHSQSQSSLDDLAPLEGGENDELRDEREALARCATRLKQDDFSAYSVFARVQQGQKHEEICEELGFDKRQKSYSLLHKAIEFLRDCCGRDTS